MESTKTKKIYSFIMVLMFHVGFSDAQIAQSVNSVIRDSSFIKKFGQPTNKPNG